MGIYQSHSLKRCFLICYSYLNGGCNTVKQRVKQFVSYPDNDILCLSLHPPKNTLQYITKSPDFTKHICEIKKSITL